MSVLEKTSTASSPPLTPILPGRHDGNHEPRDFREQPSYEQLTREAADIALANMGIIPPRTSYIGLLASGSTRTPRSSAMVDTSVIEYSAN